MLKRLLNKLNIHIHKYEKIGFDKVSFPKDYTNPYNAYIEYENYCIYVVKREWNGRNYLKKL